MTDEVGKLGYAFARIEPIQNIDRDNLTVDVTYRIDQGPRVYVERIDIKGNVRTLDSVIRREFRLAEGDPFNTVLLRRSIQRIRNLDFFEKVDVRTRQGSAPDRIVIEVDVAEKSTGSLSFGAGYSTADGPLADVRLSEDNLLGRGQALLLSFTVAARRQRIEFSFTEPYFLDRDLAAGIDLAHTQSDFQSESSFDETVTRGRLRASYELTEYLRHSVRYTIKNSDIHNVDPDASEFIRDEQGERLTSAIGQTFTYDRRDTRFLPSEGYVIRLDQDIAGLFGDNRYVRHELKGDFYYSIAPDVVLNLGGAAGFVFGFAGEDVHLSDRFFLGGSSLRGFAAAGVGPRDTDTDDALGGNLYYKGTVEVRFPLGLPKELRMFGRAFVDAGTLTEIDVSGPQLEDSGSIRVSAGIGLSWLSPLGPLAIDLAQALVKEDEDDTETFRLSFGTRF
ncbi:MAG TPA: outer membrane protein assembly factor BamA [Rhodospirillales bacterium]|nr:outer membrane protein assembly factor BamA [Rhodospirillales bacterium]